MTSDMMRSVRRSLLETLPVLLAAALLAAAGTGCSKPAAKDSTPPGAPTNVLATRGNRTITITWDAVTAEDLKGYYPYYRKSAETTTTRGTLVGPTATREATFGSLLNGTSYTVWVVAVDDAGNESPPSTEQVLTPASAADVTYEGWLAFEADDYTSARTLFEEALTIGPTYADAMSGLGWTDLREGSLSSAASNFSDAISAGMTTQDAKVGGLAVNKELPGQLSYAATLGSSALSAAPNYIFAHDNTVTADLVRVMLAQVDFRLGSASFTSAQSLADAVLVNQGMSASGLSAGNSATWVVDGETYPSYAGALLALIEYLYTLL